MSIQDCIKIEVLESMADGTVDGERRPLIESHLAGCASCRGAAAALFRKKSADKQNFAAPEELTVRVRGMVRQEAVKSENEKPIAGSESRFSWLQPVVGFAALLLVIAIGFWSYTLMRIQPEQDGDVFRESGSGQQRIEITSPAGRSFAEGSVIDFRWKAVEGAKKYNLVVSNAGGDIIEEIETPDTEFQKALRPSGIDRYLYWQVKTMLADGTEIESETRKIVFK